MADPRQGPDSRSGASVPVHIYRKSPSIRCSCCTGRVHMVLNRLFDRSGFNVLSCCLRCHILCDRRTFSFPAIDQASQFVRCQFCQGSTRQVGSLVLVKISGKLKSGSGCGYTGCCWCVRILHYFFQCGSCQTGKVRLVEFLSLLPEKANDLWIS